VLFYALGSYTPVFHLMYDLRPVSLYRRPADATFVLVALVASIAGYLVHRWLTGTVPQATPWQRVLEVACPIAFIVVALAIAHSVVGVRPVIVPIATAIVLTAAAVAVLVLARLGCALAHRCWRWSPRSWRSTALNNALHVRPRCRAIAFPLAPPRATRPYVAGGADRAAAAPDGRDQRRSSIHHGQFALAQGSITRSHTIRCGRLFRRRPMRATIVALGSQHVLPLTVHRSAFADLLGVRFIATGVPVEEIDSSLKPGDLRLIAQTRDAYIYENPRALPRVTLLTDWRIADFDELMKSGWPAVDPRETVLLKKAPADSRAARRSAWAAARGSCAMPIPRSWSRSPRPAAASCCSTTSGIPGGMPASTAPRARSSRPM
jgi:hypothetical protein